MAASPASLVAELRSWRAPLRRLVLATAAFVAVRQRRWRSLVAARKGFGDFVTEVDVAAERRLRAGLLRLLPEAGFLGEESAPRDLDREWLWVVDPIDGTSNFARGLPHFAVAVALLRDRQPVLACMHCAPEGACYEAVHQRGAWRNGRRVHIGRGRLDDGAMLGCQWLRDSRRREFVPRLQRSGARIRTFGSTVTQLADVAMGRLDGNVQQQGRIWDLAAAGLVLVEAGGVLSDWAGAPVFPFRSLRVVHTATIAAPPNVHRRLLRLLAAKGQ